MDNQELVLDAKERSEKSYEQQIHKLQEEIDILQKKYDVLTTRMIKIRAILDYEF